MLPAWHSRAQLQLHTYAERSDDVTELWLRVAVRLRRFRYLRVAAGGKSKEAPVPCSFNTTLSVVTRFSFQEKDQISKTVSGRQTGGLGASDIRGEKA